MLNDGSLSRRDDCEPCNERESGKHGGRLSSLAKGLSGGGRSSEQEGRTGTRTRDRSIGEKQAGHSVSQDLCDDKPSEGDACTDRERELKEFRVVVGGSGWLRSDNLKIAWPPRRAPTSDLIGPTPPPRAQIRSPRPVDHGQTPVLFDPSGGNIFGRLCGGIGREDTNHPRTSRQETMRTGPYRQSPVRRIIKKGLGWEEGLCISAT